MACAMGVSVTHAIGAQGPAIRQANNKQGRNAAVAAADKLPFQRG